jgi:hypothetical protein
MKKYACKKVRYEESGFIVDGTRRNMLAQRSGMKNLALLWMEHEEICLQKGQA